MDKVTPLHEEHVKLGGKMVSFGGFDMPIQYPTGIKAEHMAVREKAGLFDVSHMGEFTLEGEDALDNLNYIMTNKFTEKMKDGAAKYTVMCMEDGGCVDDLLVYKKEENKYLLVVNAANIDKDFEWVKDHIFGNVTLENVSEKVGQVALQGPKSNDILHKVVEEKYIPQKYYTGIFDAEIFGKPALISRTGYTGEDGLEIYLKAEDVVEVWKKLLEAGEEFGLIPTALGARDTLRLEAALPLYGNEMDETVNPFEAGLGFAVKLDKNDFIGKDALVEKKGKGRSRIGLKVTGKGIVREHQDVYDKDTKIGHTTSGTKVPYLNESIAFALVDKKYEVGTALEVDVRGKRVPVEVVATPFYKRED
ncbi:MAG: glycine cleavage system aminomethyltransferase GcvT [Peptoniphilaceae bacterium]|nr:glycine cleavage system aminomethyltransferase GcvT [Peptoniphilaceae bacterium]MDD7383817.1 glycine cleavage system aminomethyltransferase GcvT [Peptoniphilaceae bacterium]MDY3737606.1 glycine cleavage system aminomethyltransferase GcvT [Peptoniphilaceae bacterium]